MQVARRADHILSPLPNYVAAAVQDVQSPSGGSAALGQVVGYYRNDALANGDTLWVFDDGVMIQDNGHGRALRFRDIARVTLLNGNPSEGRLLLSLHDDSTVEVPITGKRGPFYDSLEVLRFFDRVMQDFATH